MPPTSYHSGGVNVCMGDASVRFISETINAQTDHLFWDETGTPPRVYSSIAPSGKTWATRNAGLVPVGRSPYGVWGALGSINGEEAVNDP
jgi:prepilin-type processing-associated H-X9-DG protein